MKLIKRIRGYIRVFISITAPAKPSPPVVLYLVRPLKPSYGIFDSMTFTTKREEKLANLTLLFNIKHRHFCLFFQITCPSFLAQGEIPGRDLNTVIHLSIY